MNKIDELKAKKEECERLIKEEEEKLAQIDPAPLFTEHLYHDPTKPEYGPSWAKLRPLTENDFLGFEWKPELPADYAIDKGLHWHPMLTCQPFLRPSLTREIVLKGGTDGSTSLGRMFAGNIYRCYNKISEWDGRCWTLSLYLDKPEKICFGRYKTVERRREILSGIVTQLHLRSAKSGHEFVDKFLRDINIQIQDWAQSIRNKLHNQALISLLDPDNWEGGAKALLEEERPGNQFEQCVNEINARMDEVRTEMKRVLHLSIMKSIKNANDGQYPREIREAILGILKEKGPDAIGFDPFFRGLGRRRHSS